MGEAAAWLCQERRRQALVLFRKSLRDPKALAYYFVHAPKGTSLAEIAGAAGLRWTVEECFLRAKDDLGLDHCPTPGRPDPGMDGIAT